MTLHPFASRFINQVCAECPPRGRLERSCLGSVEEADFFVLLHGECAEFGCVEVFGVHIDGADLAVIVGCEGVNSAGAVYAACVNCEFVHSVCKFAAASLLFNGGENMEKL